MYKLNYNRLPALNLNAKIDNQTFMGSFTTDTVLAINEKGMLVHATCHPALKDKSVYYNELQFENAETGITEVKMTSKGKFTCKLQARQDTVLDFAGT